MPLGTPRVMAAVSREPRYEGEDVSPTTSRELRGFYTYGIGAEVFAVCGVGSFLPVTLEQLARERGVLWSDRTTSCVAKATAEQASTTIARVLKRAAGSDDQCVLPSLGNITTSSFALYTFSLAVFVQAIALASFSSVADYGNNRKKFLIIFGLVGSISSTLFILVVPQIFLLGSLLVVIGVTCLGSSFVLLNSFLPLLVANHPEINNPDHEPLNTSSTPMEPMTPRRVASTQPANTESLTLGNQRAHETDSNAMKLSTKISSTGVGLGYAGGVSLQVASILLLFVMSKLSASSTLPLRLVLTMVGLTWLAFTVPSSMWLRDRPGPPLPLAGNGSWRSAVAYVQFAWLSLWRTIKVATKLRETVIFLIAWFLLSDAIATVSGTAILFARTELKMGTVAIAGLSITATGSGIAGSFAWPRISRRLGLKSNQVIVACILLMEVVPLYGLLGYLPFIKSWGVGGLQQSWEIYPLGFIHGFVMGGLSSYCRAFFGLLIPPGSEAAFYALYAITDKGSSIFGPAVVGVIVDTTGTIRGAFFFLAVLIALPGPIIYWLVDAEKGQADAAKMALTLKESRSRDGNVDEHPDNGLDEAEGLLEDHD